MLPLISLRRENHLAVYTVHEEPEPPSDRIDRAERLVFLRDGFSWSAALWAPIWLVSRRLWIELLAYMLIVAAIVWGAELLELDKLEAGVVTLAVSALHLVIGYEAYQLERWGLERRGYATAGIVVGRNETDCERRFFEQWLPGQPILSRQGAGTGGQSAAQSSALATVPAGAAAASASPRGALAPKSRWRLFKGGTA